jgi:hypothetical protein
MFKVKIAVLEVFIFLVFICCVATIWAKIYTIRDQIQTLHNENDLMISEIENNYKMIVAMENKLYPAGK